MTWWVGINFCVNFLQKVTYWIKNIDKKREISVKEVTSHKVILLVLKQSIRYIRNYLCIIEFQEESDKY